MIIAIKTKFGHLTIPLSSFFSLQTFFSLPYSISPDTVAGLVCTMHPLPRSCHHIKPALPQEGFEVGVIIFWGQCNVRNLFLLSRLLRGPESLREA